MTRLASERDIPLPRLLKSATSDVAADPGQYYNAISPQRYQKAQPITAIQWLREQYHANSNRWLWAGTLAALIGLLWLSGLFTSYIAPEQTPQQPTPAVLATDNKKQHKAHDRQHAQKDHTDSKQTLSKLGDADPQKSARSRAIDEVLDEIFVNRDITTQRVLSPLEDSLNAIGNAIEKDIDDLLNSTELALNDQEKHSDPEPISEQLPSSLEVLQDLIKEFDEDVSEISL
jgi:hypothetical protein